jgi:DNA-directed RNA polymerase beta subunit
MSIDEDNIWEVFRALVEEKGMITHQLESYNDFINTWIPRILAQGIRSADGEISIEFGNHFLEKPMITELDDTKNKITPMQCIWRSGTYDSNLYADIAIKTGDQTHQFKKQFLGKIPVMVFSELCHLSEIAGNEAALAALKENIFEEGGYFIMRGAMKVIVMQEKPSKNRVNVYADHNKPPKYDYYSEIKSANGFHSTTTKVGLFTKNNLLYVSIPYIPDVHPIPLGVLLKALGCKDENEMIEVICPTLPNGGVDSAMRNFLINTLEYSYECSSQEIALIHIGKKGKKFIRDNTDTEGALAKINEEASGYAKHLLEVELLPHLGTDLQQKMFFVGYMTFKVLSVYLGIKEKVSQNCFSRKKGIDDRDHFANKRVSTSGYLLTTQFNAAFGKISKDIGKKLSGTKDQKKRITPATILSWIKPTVITNMLSTAIVQNTWEMRETKTVQASETYEEFNFTNSLSSKRAIVTPMEDDGGGKITGPRMLYGSQYGIVCPSATPEGKKCLTLDTLIKTPKGYIQIGKLQDGDEVYTVDLETYNIETTTIYDHFVKKSNTVRITLEDGTTIRSSPDHPFLVDGNWIDAGNLKISQQLTCKLNTCTVNKQKIINIEALDEQVDVADFTTTSSHHNFIANGIITHNCGLKKHLAISATITIGDEVDALYQIVRDMNVTSFDQIRDDFTKLHLPKVMLNGKWIGVCDDPHSFVNELKMMRRSCLLNMETSLTYDPIPKEIRIYTDAGRLIRPLLVVERGKLKLKYSQIKALEAKKMGWTDLIAQGIVEYVDKDEEDGLFVAISYDKLRSFPPDIRMKVTHCEIHPSLMFGTDVSIIPYSDHTPSPRNAYQASMGKQAIGAWVINFMSKLSGGKYHMLKYPQKPINETRPSQIIGYNKCAAGQNAVVAVCPLEGWGQEDSTIVNRAAVERGLGAITTVYVFHDCVYPEKSEFFEIPDSTQLKKMNGDASKLGEDGFIKLHSKVKKGDILIGKVVKVEDEKGMRYENKSTAFDHAWNGTVMAVQKGVNVNGYKYVRIGIAQDRDLIEGDKLASNHGQKGTIGKIMDAEDMMFSSQTGIVPDIIFNPLAIPSRMTINYLICAITGKYVCSTSILNRVDIKDLFPKKNGFNMHVDSTPFRLSYEERKKQMNEVMSELAKYGFSTRYGEEQMIDGMTGEPLKCLIYTGVVYYQRLRHMLVDKVHSRAKGPRSALTHQPNEGRSAGGGLRIGVMEKDGMVSQGCAGLTKDRMMDQSDKYAMWVCDHCGLQGIVSKNGDRNECTVCNSHDLSLIELPYATKLVSQLMGGANITIRMMLDEYETKE